jgi:hypothetical protein
MALKHIVAIRLPESQQDSAGLYNGVTFIRCGYNDQKTEGEGSREHAIKQIEEDLQAHDPTEWFIVDGERLGVFQKTYIGR